MLPREAHDHLRGIVALWLTNGNKPVDGGNDTRYDFFPGDWCDAAAATDALLEGGYITNGSGEGLGDDFITAEDLNVWPTAKGIFEAMR